MTMSIDDITDYFTHPTIPCIKGRPTRENLRELQTKIYENAASVPCELGGGLHGYLGIAMSNDQYASTVGTTFTPHVNPGPLPTYPDNATQYQIAAAKDLHQRQSKLFNEQRKVEQALRNQLVNAIENAYLETLRQEYIGYNNRSIPEIFNHLFINYGNVTYADLQKNEEDMAKPWDPDTPIELVYVQVEEAARVAELGHAPMSENKKITAAYNIINNTGEFSTVCREWRQKPEAEKTWSNFKKQFSKEYKDYKDELTSQTTHHYKANAVKTSDLQLYINQVQEKTNQDSQNFKQLCDRHDQLLLKLEERYNEIDQLKRKVLSLEKTVTKLSGITTDNTSPNNNPKYYCWTHGYTNSRYHTSRSCNDRADGHVSKATHRNRQGGCTNVMKKE